ncbi:hypothetical protein VTO73DRAFT_13970 [Trametes versicolor]
MPGMQPACSDESARPTRKDTYWAVLQAPQVLTLVFWTSQTVGWDSTFHTSKSPPHR